MSKEKLGNIFDDQGLSGMLEDRKSNLPEYLEKLAEQEKDFNPEEIKSENLEFNALHLTRADELSDNEVRTVESNNKVNKEIEKEAGTELKIEKELKHLLTKGIGIKDSQAQLSRKFSSSKVKKYFEANKKSIYNKYGQLGYTYLDKHIYDTCKEIKASLADQIKAGHNFISKLKVSDNSCEDCTMLKNGTCILTNLKVTGDPQVSTKKEAKTVIKKFGQNNFLNKKVIAKYIILLENTNPQQVITNLLNSLQENKQLSGKIDDEGKVSFRRDIDQQEMKERKIPDNKERNAKFEEDKIDNNIYDSFSESIQSGSSIKEAHTKIAKKFEYKDVDRFYKTYNSKIKKLVAFNKRQSFDTDFKSVANTTKVKDSNIFENEKRYDETKLLRSSFNMMTNGDNLEIIEKSLKNVYGTQASKFLKENKTKLERHYGQLGYTFIDSNIYDNCHGQEMRTAFNNIDHSGKQLIHLVKACDNCKDCGCNREGTCERVGLEITKHPLVRSSRKAKKVLKRASAFVPKDYIKNFEEKISKSASIKISEFTLGINKAISDERANKEFDTELPKLSNTTTVRSNQDLENREIYDETKMLREAYQMMTDGKSLNEVKTSLKKSFKLAGKFLKENKSKLERHYGQLGYVFIDSNIYDNCQGKEMKNAFVNMKHYGKQLIYSVKANKNCSGCIFNKEGTCEKVGLMISNHPLVRSPRSAKRVLEKAASFVPKDYIEKFSSKISEEGNIELISSFNLGIKKVLANAKKGLNKSASKDTSIDLTANDFLSAINPYNVDLFNDDNDSSDLINKIIEE